MSTEIIIKDMMAIISRASCHIPDFINVRETVDFRTWNTISKVFGEIRILIRQQFLSDIEIKYVSDSIDIEMMLIFDICKNKKELAISSYRYIDDIIDILMIESIENELYEITSNLVRYSQIKNNYV